MDACKQELEPVQMANGNRRISYKAKDQLGVGPSNLQRQFVGSNSSCVSQRFYGKLTRYIHSSFSSTGMNIALGLSNFSGVSIHFTGGITR